MKKYLSAFITLLALASVALATDSQIWGEMRIENIATYGQEQTYKLGALFTYLQGHSYFAWALLAPALATIGAFLIHYLLIGPKVFAHDGKKIYAFNLFNRTIHQIAAVSFIVIVPTGFVILFGEFFGGGTFVRMCKNLHGFFTIPFAIVVIPMFLMWVKDMFVSWDDLKWLMMLGGYLNKRTDQPIPAGRFNGGQKTWYWLATLGGMVMILTGAAMYFLDFSMPWLHQMTGLSQIDLLRIIAMFHNVLGIGVVGLFITHMYMSMFAIKGALHSIIDGYMGEEEVRILHSSWYKKLKEQGKV